MGPSGFRQGPYTYPIIELLTLAGLFRRKLLIQLLPDVDVARADGHHGAVHLE